jgi:hypothetical protein
MAVPIYRCNDIDFSRIKLSELHAAESSQSFMLVDYRNPMYNKPTRILVQTGEIDLPCGIFGSNSYFLGGSTGTCESIKIPLDQNNPDSVELRKHLEMVDEWADSDQMRKILFGKITDKYIYQPCIKTPSQDLLAPDYVVMKLNVIPVGTKRINKTKLKRGNGINKIDVNTNLETMNEIVMGSKIKFIFLYNKFWVNDVPDEETNKFRYGVGFKIMAIEYTPNVVNKIEPAQNNLLIKEEFVYSYKKYTFSL